MSKVFRYDEVPAVETTSGAVQGYFYDGVYIFKGIPYAWAERFQMPQPIHWEGVKDATNYGFVCPLLRQETPNGELMVPHRYWSQDEHCQSLNIWTNQLEKGAKKPVLVWIHGGGYEAGSSIEQVAFDGKNIAERGDAVLVSVNHRLNILGYLDLSPFEEKYKNSANAGHADLVAALQWVHDNITAFGGDPENVTIFGQSGGGMKVIDLMQIPAADGLFQKALVMSGVIDEIPMRGDAKQDGRKIVEALLEELHLDVENVERLETIPYRQLADAYLKVSPALAAQGIYVGNFPKANEYYVGAPQDVGFREHAYQIPMMIGTVYGEFAFAPAGCNKYQMSEAEIRAVVEKVYGEHTDQVITAFTKAYPEKNVLDLLSIDRAIREASVRVAKLFAQGSGKAYLYNFIFEFPFHHGKTAWHCSDIPFFFGNTDLVEFCGIPEVAEKLEDEIFGALLHFARAGEPGNEILPWPAVTPEDVPTMTFDRESRVRHNYDDEVFAEINKVLPPFKFADMAGEDIQH